MEEKAGVRGSAKLVSVLVGKDFVARSRTRAAVKARWKVVKEKVLPHVGLTPQQRAKLISYMESEWLDGEAANLWQDAWTDCGRVIAQCLHANTTNSAPLTLRSTADACPLPLIRC